MIIIIKHAYQVGYVGGRIGRSRCFHVKLNASLLFTYLFYRFPFAILFRTFKTFLSGVLKVLFIVIEYRLMSNDLKNMRKNGTVNKNDVPRDKIIIRTSIIGIVVNIILAAVKVVIGLASHSIAIVLDAVNNTTDATSSVVTGLGAKLATGRADKKHPFGHGRIEYLSSLIIAVLVLYAGITSLIEAIKKIISPSTPDYSFLTLVIIVLGVGVKILLGLYVKKKGVLTNSDSLVNSGKDALFDAVLSAATLVAALIFIYTNCSLEAYFGAVISLFIIKSGFEMLSETLSKILGERPESDLVKRIKEIINSFSDVKGSFDLVLNNYGPDSFLGSVHVEVEDTYPITKLDQLSRDITASVYEKTGVILTAVGVYAANTLNEEIKNAEKKVRSIVFGYAEVKQIHGFYMDTERKTIHFDIIVSFDAADRNELYSQIKDKIQAEFSDYSVQIVLDTDYTDFTDSVR